jgi:UDP-N-acetylglucosamine 2-epimerase (non-hydrolysing)
VSALSVLAVAGCRPNFVKLAPLVAEMRRHEAVTPILVHTGQHASEEMSGALFRDLGLPAPDVRLDVGPASHAVQTARLMEALEGVLLELAPDLVLVVGDVNSTLAATLTAAKLGFPVAHVEAGLRSFDREMPEEINRLVVDALADFLFASEASGVQNLRREGVSSDRLFFVGNVMVDALLGSRERIAASPALDRLRLEPRSYLLLTLHRPENVDSPEHARGLVEAVEQIARSARVVFPAHPRTRERFSGYGLWRRLQECAEVTITPPLGYLDFLRLVDQAAVVLTDSGGVQEETTVLGVPCLTLRPSTERPATVIDGTNRVVGREPEAIVEAALAELSGGRGEREAGVAPRRPELWDGHAAERIVGVLVEHRERIRALYQPLRERSTRARPRRTA